MAAHGVTRVMMVGFVFITLSTRFVLAQKPVSPDALLFLLAPSLCPWVEVKVIGQQFAHSYD